MQVPCWFGAVFGHVLPEPNRSHTEIGVARRMRWQVSCYLDGSQRFAPMPVERVPVPARKGLICRRDLLVLCSRPHLLESQKVLHIPREEDGMVHHHEIL